MISLVLLFLSLTAMLLGTGIHFWILARLESAGIKAKYIANVGDNMRAYATYRNVARSKQWPLWPGYAVFVAYVGVLLAGCSLFLVLRLLK